MGSLTSGPDIPAPKPQIIYVPQPVNNTVAPTSSPSSTETQSQEEVTSTQRRKQNLLGRERSRFGTIKTSFRGLLGVADTGNESQSHKTLLGE